MRLSPDAFFDWKNTHITRCFMGSRCLGGSQSARRVFGTPLRPAVQGKVHPGAWMDENVYVGPGAVIEPGAYIQGPTIIGEGSVVRHGAYVRGIVSSARTASSGMRPSSSG